VIVDPYKLHPVPPRVALLLDSGHAVDESGELLDLDAWPAGTRLWASYETVYRLVRDGHGEALCWRGEEIRWRHRRFEDEWRPRSSDANVIRLPFSHLRPEAQLQGFVLWRDWLSTYGAAPTGTSGSAAWSLLRARLERRLVTNAGERPPIGFTVGGRQVIGPHGPGMYRGPLAQHDLPAAYASTMAGLRYGGVWLEHDPAETGRDYTRFAGGDYPVFVRAVVKVPEGLGPLVRRPRRSPRSFLESSLRSSFYPSAARLQGVWTWEELAAAEAHGTRILRVLGGWTHRSGWYPFGPWWEAVKEGRSLGGLAGELAKSTGNALWGRFCLDAAGGRTIRSGKNGRTRSRVLRSRPGMFPAHDLTETVSGRVRARLYEAMLEAGESLVCAHTDGLWLTDGPALEGWRVKARARSLDLLEPQVLRYQRPRMRPPVVVYAGVPAEIAPEMFERKWEAAGHGRRGHVNQ
jgi:hypothetical protein